MSAGHGFEGARVVALLVSALFFGACAADLPNDGRDGDSANDGDDVAEDDEQDTDDDDDAPAAPREDAGSAKSDAGKKPLAELDGSVNPPEPTKDAAVEKAPDARTGPAPSRDGSTSTASGDSGSIGAADASTPAPSAGSCAQKRYQPADAKLAIDGVDVPVRHVNGGVTVRGVGCEQQWEGIVMTAGGRGLCSAAFISDRHLISASHCYASDGAVSLRVSAPTWDNGASHTFQAQVKRSGSNMALDVSIIDLGKPVEWATPERRFVLHAGKAAPVDLHLYGFGSGGSSGGAGTLRGVPNRATIRVTDDGRGTLRGKAGAAQLCTGDSGGPAFVENTAPVLYGINQAIVPTGAGGGRTCASTDWSILFTNVSAYMPFVEQALGTKCARKQVDGFDVAQCW